MNNEVDVKALHFVFIPRIQEHLDKFRAAFMRRPLRTANYKTPLQLWISGQILDPKHQLSEEECQFFGVDEASYEPCSNDIESVHVPPPEIQDARMNMDLQRLLDPLQESNVYGIDLFIQARDFISNYAH